MKATLCFNLPDDQNDFTLSIKSRDMFCVLWELDVWLRDEIKHHDRVEFQPVREHLYRIMEENHVNFDELNG
jgi:hypothetical protein